MSDSVAYNTSGETQSAWKIANEIDIVYDLETPVLRTDIDTGVRLDGYNGDSTAYLTFAILSQVIASGNVYSMKEDLNISLALLQPGIRFSRTSEFEAAAGDVNYSFWYDSTSETIQYYIDVDGGSTVPIRASAFITTQKLAIRE